MIRNNFKSYKDINGIEYMFRFETFENQLILIVRILINQLPSCFYFFIENNKILWENFSFSAFDSLIHPSCREYIDRFYKNIIFV
jgi:hypothetical protein